MSSNTSKLNLLKMDPVADGNQTFNIKTMLNDNWDKIDSGVETPTGAQSKADAAQTAAINWAKGYGLGSVVSSLADGYDINNLDASGFYYAINALNRPVAGNGYIIHLKLSSTYKSQKYIIASTGVEYQRVNNNGAWTSWAQLETTAGSQSKADQAEADAIAWAKSLGLGQTGGTTNMLASGTNLNTVVTGGMYRLNSSHTNTPSTFSSGQMIVVRGADTIAQIIFPYNSPKMYYRQGNPSDVGGSGSWGAWVEVATTDKAQMIKHTDDTGVSMSYGGDMNTLKTYGDYYVTSAATNKPAGFGSGLVMVRHIVSTGNVYQICIDFSSGAHVERYWNGTTWNFTNQMETIVGSQAKVDTLQTWIRSFGIGATNSPLITDPNTVTETGFYTVSGTLSNVPTGSTSGALIHHKRDGNSRPSQIYLDYLSDKMYFRNFQASGWTAWQQVVSMSNGAFNGSFVASNNGGNLVAKGTSTGTTSVEYVQFLDSAGTQQGAMGKFSSASNDISVRSNSGDLILDTISGIVKVNDDLTVNGNTTINGQVIMANYSVAGNMAGEGDFEIRGNTADGLNERKLRVFARPLVADNTKLEAGLYDTSNSMTFLRYKGDTKATIIEGSGGLSINAGGLSVTGNTAITGTLNGYTIRGSGDYRSVIPVVAADGVMEIGNIIDFHDSGTSSDFTQRITTSAASGFIFSNKVNAPSLSENGTLLTDKYALKTDLASVKTDPFQSLMYWIN